MPGHTTAAAQRALMISAEAGDAVWFRENRMRIKARAADTNGEFGLVEAWLPVGSGPPLHVHRHEDETFYVLCGQLVVRCGDEELTVGPGDLALLPRDVPHTFLAIGEQTTHVLNLITPGGAEELFVRAGRPAQRPGLPPPEPADIDGLIRQSAELGIEILGPPMTI
jgi:mannose-6-phosphate isomerase-like protein (cupin superfamily)